MSQPAVGNRQLATRGGSHSRLPTACFLPPRASSSGFTFLEILIASGMFVLLLGAVLSVFTLFTRQQRIGLTAGALVGEAETFLEVLEREVRTAFGTTFSNPSGASSVRMRNQNGQEVTYRLDASGLRIIRDVGGSAEFVTGDQVDVRELTFSVTTPTVDVGTPPQVPILTGQQGRVTVGTRLCPRGVDDARCLVLQTTLTARQYAPP